jgi:hypothetical protein|tara:strand:+ start:396 stop:953 length:558 start_codon:yes stop_codon:yes gene_type:complete
MINNGKIKGETVKKLIKVLSCLCFFLIGCSNFNWTESDDEVFLELDPRLQVDDNGYYHLSLDITKWQTLHRFSGTVTVNRAPLENLRLNWESSHYWYLGDTLGYFIRRVINAEGHYVSLDTSYAIGFDGMEVPTINPASYSNGSGEFNQMFAPVRSMVGDTVTVWIYFWDFDSELRETEFYVVLD